MGRQTGSHPEMGFEEVGLIGNGLVFTDECGA